ncbi:MAG: hypothetical protein ACI4RH_00745 [Huintestinicola sp.]
MNNHRILVAVIAAAISAVFSACGAAKPVYVENTESQTKQAVSETSFAETSAEDTTESLSETTTEAVTLTETFTETESETEAETEAETEEVTQPAVVGLKAGIDPMLDELYSVNRDNAEVLYENSIAKAYSFESAAKLVPFSRTNTSDTFSARLWTYMGDCTEMSFTMLRKDSGLISDKGLLLGTWVGIDDELTESIGGKPTVSGATIFHYGKEIINYDALRKSTAEGIGGNSLSDEETEEYMQLYVDPLKEHFVYCPVYVQPFYDEEGYACVHLTADDNTFAQLRIAVSEEGYAALMSPDIGVFFPSVCSDKEITDQDFTFWSYGFLETDSVYYPLTKPSGGDISICDASSNSDYRLTMDEFSSFCGNECLLGSWVNGVSVY